MALNRNTSFPGRYETPNAAQPQGAFRNRTSDTSQDGSYFTADVMNDWSAFFSSLLTESGTVINGIVDEVGSSQYYDSLVDIIENTAYSTGKATNIITFTSSGVYNPTSGVKSIAVTVVGAGGGNAQLFGPNQVSMSGYSGAVAKVYFTSTDIDLTSSVNVTIGAGNVGPTTITTQGTEAGASSFGSFITCRGGISGYRRDLPATGETEVWESGRSGAGYNDSTASYTAGSLIFSHRGKQGTPTVILYSRQPQNMVSGHGGETSFGHGTNASRGYGLDMSSPTFGCGAAGVMTSTVGGSVLPTSGGNGLVIIEEFF